jgi:anti-anti-sigma factor
MGPSTAPFHIEPTADGLRIAGEVDISNAHLLTDALASAATAKRDVVLDVAGLSFMDSTGIQVLLRAGKSMPAGTSLVINNPGPLVLNLLRLIRADRMPGLRIVEPTD